MIQQNQEEEASINSLSSVMVTVVHMKDGTIVQMTGKGLNLQQTLFFLLGANSVWHLALCLMRILR